MKILKKHSLTLFFLTITIVLLFGKTDNVYATAAAGFVPLETVATPTISPASETVILGTKVAISCDTVAASVYYTTDGSDPTVSSATYYKSPITLTGPMVIKAIAVKQGMLDSKIMYQKYIPIQLSDKCDVTAVTSPTGATITGTDISLNLDYTVYNQVIALTISPNASWKLYSNHECTKEIADKCMDLYIGINTAYVKVTAQDGITSKIYKISMIVGQKQISPISTTQQDDNNPVAILVNGKSETAATAVTISQGNKKVTTVTVNDKKLEEQLQSEENNINVTIPVNSISDVSVVTLNGQTVKDMENRGDILEVKTDSAAYILPAKEINIDSLLQQLGNNVELKDIKVNISIAKASDDTVKIAEDAANKNNYQVVVEPIIFKVTAENGDKTTEISKFNSYIQRMIAIPEGVDPLKITTGVALNGDGIFSHMPTTVTVIDGKYYAKISSLTNSTYSLVYSPKIFKDVENHWAKNDISNMASRLIISGAEDDKFEPDRDITRGEFAAIIVRGLGLMRSGTGKDSFSDVSKSDWYYEAISIANDYGLIKGKGNNSFEPNEKITREEAMVIIERAMIITKLKTELTPSEVQENLKLFKDESSISAWAENSAAACINNGIISGSNNNIEPNQNITRAEAAVVIERLLQKSNLIN